MPMNMQQRVEALPGTPLPHGLLESSCTDIVQAGRRELMGVEWLSTLCCTAGCTTWCPEDTDPCSIPEKEFCDPQSIVVDPITVYAGVQCEPGGIGFAEASRRARDSLDLGVQRSLEQWVMRNILSPRATDVTPAAGAVSLPEALAFLEGRMAMESGAVGVLHVPAAASALLDYHSLVHHGGDVCDPSCLVTGLGNCVIPGAGYQANLGPSDPGADPPVAPEPAPDGELWLYASGPVRVRQSDVIVVPPDEDASINPNLCIQQVLAERTYLVQVDCPITAIRARLCPCGC